MGDAAPVASAGRAAAAPMGNVHPVEALPFLAALGVGCVHVFAGRLRFLGRIPRSRWLSAAGGISVSYVFVHVLPDLAEAQRAVEERSGAFPFLERHVYLLALVGLAAFYGVERSAQRSRARRRASARGDRAGERVFWVAIASFAFFNVLVGYLLVHRLEEGRTPLVLFAVAMALHFLVNDVGLRDHHEHAYHRYGRWILAAMPLVGWVVGTLATVSEAALAVPFAFVAGGVVLNVLKEELPKERESRFGAFALGAAAYAALLVAVVD